MMSLPSFENPDITTQELLAEQERLKFQADKMLKKTHLLKIFGKYGEVQPIGGSYSYGLMVYPDLDMDVIKSELTKKDFVNLASDILASDFVRKVTLVDNIAFTTKRPSTPKGYWIGIEIPYDNDVWGIDLWLKTREEFDNYKKEFTDYQLKLSSVTEQQKAAILLIKYHLIRRGKYGKRDFMSVDIYNAVLDKGIYSLQEFLKVAEKN